MALKKKHEKAALIIDIGATSVGGALVSESHIALPMLQTIVRSPIGVADSPNELLQQTTFALKTLLDSYKTADVGAVRAVVSMPWHEAHIRTIVSSSEKLAQISEKNVALAVSRYQDEKPPKSGNTDVEAVAIHVQVNGYGTALKRIVEGTTLAVNLYESEMNSAARNHLLEPLESAFPNIPVTFNTFPLVSLVALRSILPEKSFSILVVAGETSQLFIVREDGIRHFASFPTGFYTIARAVGGKKDRAVDALSRLALLARGELSDDEEKRVREAFQKAFAPWKSSFNTALEDASEHTPVPQTLYLVAEKEHVPWLKRGLEETDTLKLSVRAVDAPLVQAYVEIGEGEWYDIPLSLSALFFHTTAKEVIGEQQENAVIEYRK